MGLFVDAHGFPDLALHAAEAVAWFSLFFLTVGLIHFSKHAGTCSKSNNKSFSDKTTRILTTAVIGFQIINILILIFAWNNLLHILPDSIFTGYYCQIVVSSWVYIKASFLPQSLSLQVRCLYCTCNIFLSQLFCVGCRCRRLTLRQWTAPC